MIEWDFYILWEPRDIWFGIYWNTLHRSKPRRLKYKLVNNWLDIYICIVPMIPIKIRFWRKYKYDKIVRKLSNTDSETL